MMMTTGIATSLLLSRQCGLTKRKKKFIIKSKSYANHEEQEADLKREGGKVDDYYYYYHYHTIFLFFY